ncbi:MAG: T9SS type A sorting domain-containing protein [Flavobacteriales bacterium]
MPYSVPLLLCAALFNALVLHAQPAIDWQHNYGGSLQDRGYSIAPTADGGYVILGETRSSDGMVVGFHGGPLYDLWVLKLDAVGNIEWQRCLGSSESETPGTIAQTPDGGYILVGNAGTVAGDVSESLGNGDIWLVRLTADGSILWDRAFGGTDLDLGVEVAAMADGTYIVLGTVYSMDLDASDNHGAGDMWLGHVDTNGILLQSRCYGGNGTDVGRTMRSYPDGVVVFGGVTNSNDGDVTGNPEEGNEAWVVYLANGWDISWQTVLGGAGDDQARGLYRATGDTVLVAVSSNSQNGDVSAPWGDVDYWIVKLGLDGSLLNQRSFGGSGQDVPSAIVPSGSPNMFYVSGRSSSTDGLISAPNGATDCWTVCLNYDLDMVWEKSYGGSQGDGGNSLCLAPDGGLVIGGYSLSNDIDLGGNFGLSDLWVVKLEPEDVGVEEAGSASGLRVFPNPATEQLSINWEDEAWSITVYDAQGKLVASVERLAAGQRQAQLNVVPWADGLYTIRLYAAGTLQVQRFAKQ